MKLIAITIVIMLAMPPFQMQGNNQAFATGHAQQGYTAEHAKCPQSVMCKEIPLSDPLRPMAYRSTPVDSRETPRIFKQRINEFAEELADDPELLPTNEVIRSLISKLTPGFSLVLRSFLRTKGIDYDLITEVSLRRLGGKILRIRNRISLETARYYKEQLIPLLLETLDAGGTFDERLENAIDSIGELEAQKILWGPRGPLHISHWLMASSLSSFFKRLRRTFGTQRIVDLGQGDMEKEFLRVFPLILRDISNGRLDNSGFEALDLSEASLESGAIYPKAFLWFINVSAGYSDTLPLQLGSAYYFDGEFTPDHMSSILEAIGVRRKLMAPQYRAMERIAQAA